MKSIYIVSSIFLLALLGSCSKFEELNTDPTKPTGATTSQLILFAEKKPQIFYTILLQITV